jgi:hypothetical protein
MGGLHGDRLDGWIARVEVDQLPDLHSFTGGLKRDLDAVVNGLTLPYSSGAVEGAVNRVKMLKARCTAEPASTPSFHPPSTGGCPEWATTVANVGHAAALGLDAAVGAAATS